MIAFAGAVGVIGRSDKGSDVSALGAALGSIAGGGIGSESGIDVGPRVSAWFSVESIGARVAELDFGSGRVDRRSEGVGEAVAPHQFFRYPLLG